MCKTLGKPSQRLDNSTVRLNDFKFEIKEPGGEDPRPSFLVSFWITIRQPVNQLINQPGEEDDAGGPAPKALRRIERKVPLTGYVMETRPTEEMPVRRIGESVHAREVRNGDADDRVVTANSMDLFHRRNHIIAVLQNIIGQYFGKLPISKRPWGFVEVMDHIGVHPRILIQIHCFWQVLEAASKIQRSR